MIHETAIIHPNAKLASDVSVGAYSFIGEGVEIGSGCIIESHVVIKGPAFIGKNNRFFQFGSIGEECQDKKYAGEVTRLEIGDNNIFREYKMILKIHCQTSNFAQIMSESRDIQASD